MTPSDTIVILDFGSQLSQLIARRVREAQVYCEMFHWDTDPQTVQALHPKAYILSGGPNSVYALDAPHLPEYVLEAGVPVLGICYGMQLLAHHLGGQVVAGERREYGRAIVTPTAENTLLPAVSQQVWMSHGDKVETLPSGFFASATSPNCAFAGMENPARQIYAVQFHPEVRHTEFGTQILDKFLTLSGLARTWNAGSFIESAIAEIRAKVGTAKVISAVSGGVDSSVATALVHRAIGDQLTCFYVDTGLMRLGESEQVVRTFRENLGAHLEPINAIEDFLSALEGLTEPEAKRKAIGEKFIRIFERTARQLGKDAQFLVQGTIYPDVVESQGKGREKAAKIKTHHNVGGLPDDLKFNLLEPLRYLFKDEVRAVGTALGLPDELVWRQPFPGPGLGIRCLGTITWQRLETLRAADHILLEELGKAGLLRHGTAQAFAVLLPVKSVGVMGDARTYEEVLALRAVATDDFMTADWARLPYDLLAHVSNRICNEVPGINRVVYDITSKPPATIEWE
ncbi:MAG TPA: glutamine-hydrolyzing GMP synthase [Anaerolineales bacterium]|nr:glutamine-hydrolyzing GMP synthase [Anaerolineales bacterium]